MWPQSAEAKRMLKQFVQQGMWANVDQYPVEFTEGITSQPVRTPQPPPQVGRITCIAWSHV